MERRWTPPLEAAAMPRHASEASNDAVAFVLGGGSTKDALIKWPSVGYKNLWNRVGRVAKKRLEASASLHKHKPAAAAAKVGSLESHTSQSAHCECSEARCRRRRPGARLR